MLSDNPWLNLYQPRPLAKVRLFCFPHAGCAAATYGGWAAALPPDIESYAIEYPGRGARRAERPFVRLPALVAALLTSVGDAFTMPFATFGHCLGALIAFELVRQLQRQGQSPPVAMFVAGCRGPSLPPRKPPVYTLSEPELLDELRALNGMSDDMLARRDLLDLFLPTLRADFEVGDTYVYRPAAKIDCPIIASAGAADPETPPDDLQAWAAESHEPLIVRRYPGDHFFLRTAEASVLHDLARDLLGRLECADAT